MGRRQAAMAGSDNSEFTHGLLARLGLPPEASAEQIATARDRLVAFLESAPPELESWARQQAKAADAAFALLSSPAADLPAQTLPDGRDDEPKAADEPDDDSDGSDFDGGDFDRDAFDRDAFDDDPGRPAAVPTGRRRRLSRFSPVLVVLVIAAIVYGVYQSGGQTSAHSQSVDATASPTAKALDEEKVLALMNKLQSNPKDVETLRNLGDLYFGAGDYATAASWQQKIVDINPRDTTALLTLGIALFNTGDTASAEKHWLKVIEIDPANAEAHYDLGFLYLSKNPPETEKAKAEWNKVIELDPNSELAKVVSTHLDQLASPAATSPTSGSGK